MMRFDTWHLPDLDETDIETSSQQFGDAELRVAMLTPSQVQQVITTIEAARAQHLAHMPTARIVAAIDEVAARFASPATLEGKQARALLPAVTGYSPQTVEDILTHMSRDWRAESLNRLLVSELGTASGIDMSARPNAAFARGPNFAFHIFSGNVPGVAVTSVIRSLLVKAGTFGKSASGEPVLPALFARALREVAPELADCLAVAYWPGGTRELEAVAIAAADTVIVYGGEDVVKSVSTRIAPEARLVVHGPRISVGLVARNADPGVARDIAAATAAYDQQGCVSPHVVYVEKGGPVDPLDLARAIAHELEKLEASHPRRRINASEAVAIRDARARAEFSGRTVFGPEHTGFTVIYDDADDALVASCLNRTLHVKTIENAAALKRILEPHRALLQSVALAGFDGDEIPPIASLLTDSGVTRITTFERLPWPPMHWHHDGRGPLEELLTWHDLDI